MSNTNNIHEKTLNKAKIQDNSKVIVDKKPDALEEEQPNSGNNINLTLDQEKVYNSLVKFLCEDKDKELLLIGYAGTGKTTLVTKFINDILNKKLCKKIVIAAPTHKAVNIAKSKLFSSSYGEKLPSNIDIMTIHRLLNYQNFIDSSGEVYYAKGKCDSNWNIYNLVVVDECSMLSNQIINDIGDEINKKSNSKIKIIYVGDPAQLPPVNQSDSKIFNKDIKKLLLTKIIRTNSNNIMELSNSHRMWIESKDKIPYLSDYENDRIILHSNENTEKWLNKFVQQIKSNKPNEKLNKKPNEKSNEKSNENKTDNINDNNIILTWTNKKCDGYNNYVREKLFSKKNLDKYEPGEILIFNDFHRILTKNFTDEEKSLESKDNKEQNEKNKIISFYTSEQIKLCKISQSKFTFEKIKNSKNVELPNEISDLFTNILDDVNKILSKTVLNVYNMEVIKLSEIKKEKIPIYDIICIHNNSENQYNKLKEYFETLMTKLKNSSYKIIENLKINKKTTDQVNMLKLEYFNIVEKKINRIWKEWQSLVIERFAQLNYGYSITVHKSQGSTFKNVFIDIKDIFSNTNYNEKLKCLYTAITRSSYSLELLI
jgi:hypothetical protein